MKQRIKDEWVAMLRYGGLKQRTGSLTNYKENSFCCLGVLCEMARSEGIVDLDEIEGVYISKKDSRDNSYLSLPMAVQKWAKLDSHNPSPYGLGLGNSSLAELNDMGNNFESIASVIEEKL